MDIEPLKTFDAVNYTTGAGGILILSRFLFKLFRKDISDIHNSKESDNVLNSWKDMAEAFKKSAQENALRADVFANERNKAIEEIGTLKGEIKALTSQIERLEDSLTRMQSAVALLRKSVTSCGPDCKRITHHL